MSEPAYSATEPVIGQSRATRGVRVGSSGSSLQARRSSGAHQLSIDTTCIDDHRASGMGHGTVNAKFGGWWATREGKDLPADLRDLPCRVTVMAYNVLANRYVRSENFSHCDVSLLAEGVRLEGVWSEIQGANPDLLFLEEISSKALAGPFGQHLYEAGYTWLHVPITTGGAGPVKGEPASVGFSAGPTPAVNRGKGPKLDAGLDDLTDAPEHEGVAIVWRQGRFDMLHREPVRFNALAAADPALSTEQRAAITRSSHNVAAVATLLDRGSGCLYVAATTHALWDQSRPEAQLWQMTHIAAAVERCAAAAPPGAPAHVIIGGDLNAEPTQASIQFLRTGAVPPASVPATATPGVRGARHGLQLKSAYESYFASHQGHVTRNEASSESGGVIDHLFFSSTALVCTAVGRTGGKQLMPTACHPSDHFPIAAQLLPVCKLDEE